MWRRQKDEGVRVLACAKCSIYDTEYVVVLSGSGLPVGSLFELVKRDHGLDMTFAVVEVMEENVAGGYQARPIWTMADHNWGPCPDVYVYPNVLVRPHVTRETIESCMADAGTVADLAHVLEANGRIYLVYRRNGISAPWICYVLESNSGEYFALHVSVTLSEMKAKLSELCPLQKQGIDRWGNEGAKVIDVTDYGARGNGAADDTVPIFRAFKAACRGDVVYFPHGKTFRVSRELSYPAGVQLDVRDGQIMVVTAGDMGV